MTRSKLIFFVSICVSADIVVGEYLHEKISVTNQKFNMKQHNHVFVLTFGHGNCSFSSEDFTSNLNHF